MLVVFHIYLCYKVNKGKTFHPCLYHNVEWYFSRRWKDKMKVYQPPALVWMQPLILRLIIVSKNHINITLNNKKKIMFKRIWTNLDGPLKDAVSVLVWPVAVCLCLLPSLSETDLCSLNCQKGWTKYCIKFL